MNKPAFITCPKRKPYRDSHLLKMAKGRVPVAQLPGHYDTPDTTVAAHPNGYIFGKGGASKADDFLVIYIGYHAHAWFDQGNASREEKEAFYWGALLFQLNLYRNTLNDPYEPKKNKESARKALEAFSNWVTQNQRLFEPGDWQLEWVR